MGQPQSTKPLQTKLLIGSSLNQHHLKEQSAYCISVVLGQGLIQKGKEVVNCIIIVGRFNSIKSTIPPTCTHILPQKNVLYQKQSYICEDLWREREREREKGEKGEREREKGNNC